jgi:hypothetical protein
MPEEAQAQALRLLQEPTSATPSEDIVVASEPEAEVRPVVAHDGLGRSYLVVWQDRTDEMLTNIYARHLDENGIPVGSRFEVALNRPGPVQVKVFSGGGIFLVLWREGPDRGAGSLFAKRITGELAEDPSAEPIQPVRSPIENQFAAAYNPDLGEFVLLWLDPRNSALASYLRGEVFARRMDSSGAIGAEVGVVSVPANPTVDQILNAPAYQTDLGAAYDPDTGEYLLSYGIYICTTSNCTIREEVRAQRVDADSLSRLGAAISVTTRMDKIQWAARPVYDPRLKQYVVFWNDNRADEGDFTIFAQRIGPSGAFLSSNLRVVGEAGSQFWPEVAYLDVAAPMPRYFLVWEDEPTQLEHFARGVFLSDGLVKAGEILDLSADDEADQRMPQVASDDAYVPNVVGIWQHTRPMMGPDVHGVTLSALDYKPVNVVSPVDWTMVLSIRPTFRWQEFEGADTYIIRLSHATSTFLVGESLSPFVGLGADATRDPADPTMHVFRSDRDLHSGPTLEEGGYYWWVEAQSASGETIGRSRPEAFQIPPLGLWENMRQAFPGLKADNPHWNQYDDLIYYWSEVRDIPPDVVKAVIVGETGSQLAERMVRLPTGYPGHAHEPDTDTYFSPVRAYMYEPSLDWIAFDSPDGVCREDWPPADCTAWRRSSDFAAVRAFSQPGNPTFSCSQGQAIEECAALAASQGTPYPYDDARGGFEFYEPFTIGDFLYPFGAGYSNLNHLEWMGDQGYDIDQNYQDGGAAYAQYRTVASFGLGQIVFLGDKSRWLGDSLDDLLPPELLYEPDLNLRVASRILAHHRCWQIDEFGLPYAGAEDTDWDRWYWPVVNYAGDARKFDRAGVYFALTHPTSLAGPDVLIQRESPPAELPDAFIEAENQTVCQDASSASAARQGVLLISRSVDIGAEEEVARGLVDLKGSGTEVLVIASATVPGEASPFRNGVMRIYADDTPSVVEWELTTARPVESIALLTFHPASGSRPSMLQVDWPAGAHGLETYFLYWDGTQYGVVPIISADDLDGDGGIASSGGGVQVEPDGSIVVYQRGENALDQSLGDVYVFDNDRYSLSRTFHRDSSVLDEIPPSLQFEASPSMNADKWYQPAVAIRISAQDNADVWRTYVTWVNTGQTDSGELILPQAAAEFSVGEGTWRIAFGATDVYGNESDEQVETVMADGTGPATESRLDGVVGPGGVYTSPVAVTLSAADPVLADGSDGSGVETVEFLVNGEGDWETYESELEIAAEGSYTIRYRAVDRAGNVGPEGLTGFEIVPRPAIAQISDFVLLGAEGILLEQNVLVLSGDVGASLVSAGPFLAEGSEVTLGVGATVSDPESQVMGDSVYLSKNAQVSSVYYNELHGTGAVLGDRVSPFDLPLVAAFPNVPVFSPGTQDIDVRQNTSLTVDAGSYGLLRAHQGSTIMFTGGVYEFSEWDVDQNVDLFFEATSEIRIAGRLLVAQASYLGPEPGLEGLDARDIVIFVGGINGSTGGFDETPVSAEFRVNADIYANVYVPNGTLVLGKNGHLVGAFLARWIDVGINAEVEHLSQWTEGNGN